MVRCATQILLSLLLAILSGITSVGAQGFPEFPPKTYIFLGSPPEPSLERPQIEAPRSNTNVRPYWRYLLPNGGGCDYSESVESTIATESTTIVPWIHLKPEILYANRINLDPCIDQNFRLDWLDSTGQTIKVDFQICEPVPISCLEFPQSVPVHFTVSNFKRFLANKRFDLKQVRMVKQPNKPDLAAIRQQKISEQAALRQKTIFDNYRCVMHLYYTARRLAREYLETTK